MTTADQTADLVQRIAATGASVEPLGVAAILAVAAAGLGGVLWRRGRDRATPAKPPHE